MGTRTLDARNAGSLFNRSRFFRKKSPFVPVSHYTLPRQRLISAPLRTSPRSVKMDRYRTIVFLCAIAFCVAFLSAEANAQSAPANEHPGRAVHILGFADAPKNLKCTLVVEGSSLKLKSKGHDQEVLLPSVEDVLTGADSVRAIGGTLGAISMFGPYGSGRFLSLFR